MRIAIQGELGSFSHEAAVAMAAHSGEVEAVASAIVPCALSSDVFRTLSEKTVDAAVIPIENSLAGPVAEHFDLLLDNKVLIERESLLRISHNLIARPGTPIADIARVSSHPVALAQCRRFFDEHPAIRSQPFYDTAGSVKLVMEGGDSSLGAIASRQAAEQYGGEILAAGIEDSPANFTRFFLVRHSELAAVAAEANKVSIAFTVENRPGTLVEALQIFADHQTNMTKIESRPVHGKPWDYVFFVDYHISTPAQADDVFRSLSASCSMVKELGRYVAAPHLAVVSH